MVDPAAASRSTTSCEAKTRIKLLRLPSYKRQEGFQTQPYKRCSRCACRWPRCRRKGEIRSVDFPGTVCHAADTRWTSSHSGGSRPHSLVTTRADSLAAGIGGSGEVGKCAVTMIVMRIRRTSQSQLRVANTRPVIAHERRMIAVGQGHCCAGCPLKCSIPVFRPARISPSA